MLLLAATVPCVARAGGAPELSVEIAAGFDGRYRIGSALPVTVMVENRDRDWAGVLEVEAGDASASVPAHLPAPSLQAFYLELPALPAAAKLTARLIGRDGALAVGRDLEPLPDNGPFHVVVSDRLREGLFGVPARLAAGRQAAVVGAGELPRSWEGYSSVDAMVFEAAGARALEPAQIRAMSDWLVLGGRLLIVAPEPSRLRAPLLRWSLVPEGADAGRGELPETFSRGRGRVRLATLDLRLEEIGTILAELDGEPRRGAEAVDRRLLAAAPGGEEVSPRPAPTVALFFLVYLVAVGMVMGRLSRAPGRPLVAWVGSVAVALVFTLGACAMGRLGGSGWVGQSAAVVHLFPGTQDAWVTARVDLQAPVRRRVELGSALRDARLVEAGDVRSSVRRFDPSGAVSMVLPASMWGRSRVEVSGFAPWPLELEDAGSGWRLVNASGIGLQDCNQLVDGGTLPRGDLPAGGSLPVDAAAGGSGAPRGSPLEGTGESFLAGALAEYRLAADPGELLICALPALPDLLVSEEPLRRHSVSAVAVVHLPPAGAVPEVDTG